MPPRSTATPALATVFVTALSAAVAEKSAACARKSQPGFDEVDGGGGPSISQTGDPPTITNPEAVKRRKTFFDQKFDPKGYPGGVWSGGPPHRMSRRLLNKAWS